ncbi:hypothetical protein Cri9333_1841 [Crinalium epipsammum PCC 9333]|uniref:Uncharacterized protein n=1 Tax=Crinalium epipsammum PCC 9333 TaxID=1173022 RepID=K9VZX2_9CYAN|nr:hypothetical protein [Crinalium epipsammum]AFZ12725.1 hypothetical protein Cri9333_1841 [Crinalium epipsammum PCC 9333]
MDFKEPIESAISELQEGRSSRPSRRQRFFDTLKHKYSNLHTLYVTTNVIAIWSGMILLSDSWARKANLIADLTPDFSLEVALRHLSLLILGLLMLLLDDLSLQELLLMKKTPSQKAVEDMNSREKVFHYFKIRYPNLSTIYTLIAIILSWCGIWGLIWDIPMQPFWRSLLTIFLGLFLLYIDDLKLEEL